jgi:tripartite-type tricarboxylate transporter receptor subunit TctC
VRQISKTIATVVVALATLEPLAGALQAEPFPSKSVRIISPYSPGSGPDQMMRVIGENLAKMWKQPVVLEARPGGGGIPAMEALKAAPPDGHTLGIASDTHLTTNPFLYRSLSYGPSDFAPVMPLFSTPFYMIVATKGPYGSLGDLITDAQSRPDKVSYGSLFVGSQGHLGGALLASRIKAQMVFVPYRDAQQMIINIANGDLSWAFSSLATVRPMLDAGLLKLIAVAGTQRSRHLPDVPTLAEGGGPEMVLRTWLGLLAPKDTPSEVVRQINADMIKVFADPAVQERLRVSGFDLDIGSPEVLAKAIVDDAVKNGEFIRQLGVHVQ